MICVYRDLRSQNMKTKIYTFINKILQQKGSETEENGSRNIIVKSDS